MIRGTLLTLLFLFLTVLETSAFPHPATTKYFSLPLIVLVLVVVLSGRQWSWPMAVVAGSTLDLFSPFPFGTHLLTLVTSVILTDTLFLRFFTNRSFYGMIVLVIVASSWSLGCLFIANWLLQSMDEPVLSLPPTMLLWQPLGNLLTALFLFYFLHALGSVYRRFSFGRTERVS